MTIPMLRVTQAHIKALSVGDSLVTTMSLESTSSQFPRFGLRAGVKKGYLIIDDTLHVVTVATVLEIADEVRYAEFMAGTKPKKPRSDRGKKRVPYSERKESLSSHDTSETGLPNQ